jgi:hypothetical protein
LDSNKIGIYVTDRPVKNIAPKDYTIQFERILLNVSECGANSFEIGICGEGKSDGLGAVIDNVKLFNLDECQYNIM